MDLCVEGRRTSDSLLMSCSATWQMARILSSCCISNSSLIWPGHQTEGGTEKSVRNHMAIREGGKAGFAPCPMWPRVMEVMDVLY